MQKTKNNLAYKIIAVLTGALLLGFLWRVRGEHGWGSSWGLLSAGFLFTMFLTTVTGERKKLDFGWLGVTAVSFMMTVPSWGTLLNQMTGILNVAPDVTMEISTFSGVAMMVTMGFGLSTVYGLMLGRGYSEKQWKVKDFVIILAVFYITDLVCKASVSHWILNLIQPEAALAYEQGLAIKGVEGSVYEVYMQHFDDLSWNKDINGIRNYASSIQAISSAIRSVCTILATRFIVKDKISAKTGAVTSLAFAFSITVSDLFFYFGSGGYHMLSESPFGESISVWSCWEFFTGFIAGGIITYFILTLKPNENPMEKTFNFIPEPIRCMLTFILCYGFLCGVNIVRPILERFDESEYQLIATIVAVIVAIIFALTGSKQWGIRAENIGKEKLYSVLLLIFSTYVFIVYMLIGEGDHFNIASMDMLHTILCTAGYAVTLGWSVYKIKTT